MNRLVLLYQAYRARLEANRASNGEHLPGLSAKNTTYQIGQVNGTSTK